MSKKPDGSKSTHSGPRVRREVNLDNGQEYGNGLGRYSSIASRKVMKVAFEGLRTMFIRKMTRNAIIAAKRSVRRDNDKIGTKYNQRTVVL